MTLLSFLHYKKTSLTNWKWFFFLIFAGKKSFYNSAFLSKAKYVWKMLKFGFYLRQNGKSSFMLQFDFPFVQ